MVLFYVFYQNTESQFTPKKVLEIQPLTRFQTIFINLSYLIDLRDGIFNTVDVLIIATDKWITYTKEWGKLFLIICVLLPFNVYIKNGVQTGEAYKRRKYKVFRTLTEFNSRWQALFHIIQHFNRIILNLQFFTLNFVSR